MKWVSLFLSLIFLLILTADSEAQQSLLRQDYTLLESRLYQNSIQDIAQADTTEESNEFPTPKSVLYKSLIIPGWGQVVNDQIWKVPIIYGMFTGLGVYTSYVNGQYKDYRAAYYNAIQGQDSDLKFGPTPERLEGVNSNQLQSNRNNLRNRRDLMFVIIGLAYGLNALDAYIYAHMRSFDVSDDLSAKTTIQPTILAEGSPGVKVKFSISKK
ncbi:DUF5683 domain-containing protein [Rhodohalobacter sulfatireducens]|uniref:DUF5683 domain-containing protein n=1 Tax=Rhodohalobacter sulfatireducens TaxID=2911366 RepID=A0ABS9KBC4_9BACT|nr:DUF5683 domain-containing protein [Rhodohalobacter sulfatireducens]MCG2588160.1 DUF5683 domain-containing protein [Rhodohalobacter sulfatireducens]MDR9365124.1 DUF5683 domain-containing protein [Balneolaceae bacterium]MDR9410533.1 DUF5683 domain-containing protein [Balneolaceae bacterium]